MVAMEQTARCQIAIELYCLTTHVSHFLLLTMKIVKPDLFLTQNSVEFPFLIFFYLIILEIYCALFTPWLDVPHSPASIQLSNSTKPSENIAQNVFKFVYAHRDINIHCVCEFTSLVHSAFFVNGIWLFCSYFP